MPIKKWITTVFALLLACVLLLSACQPSVDPSGSEASGEPANSAAPVDSSAVKVPILMYHSFTTDPESGGTLQDNFRDHITALKAAGYQPIFYRELIDYVYHAAALPEKPILITIDDGYQNNIDLAVPILEEYGFRATIAVIGVSIGKVTYKDTDFPITPHFSLEDAAPYVESGILDIQPHSYDMHQVAVYDGEDCRRGVLQMEGEDRDDYTAALTADFLRVKGQIESALDVECNVFTYPYGSYLHELLTLVVKDFDFSVNFVGPTVSPCHKFPHITQPSPGLSKAFGGEKKDHSGVSFARHTHLLYRFEILFSKKLKIILMILYTACQILYGVLQ